MSDWLQTTDIDSTETNNGMFNDGSGFGVNSASDMSNGFVDNFLDPTGFVKGFYNDVLGFTSQEREFEQQFLMTEKQNEWNSAAAQMERAKAAGINPLTAAAGIAGSGSSGVAPAAGSATPSSAIGDVIGLPSEMAARAAQSEASKAAAEQARSVARNADRLADAQIFNEAANAASFLVGCGVPEIAAMAVGLSSARNGMQGFMDAFNTDNICRRYDSEMDLLDSQINAENMRYENLQAQVGLYRSEAELAAAKALHENILGQFDTKRLELAKKYEAMLADSDNMQQFLIAQQFGVDSPEYQAVMRFYRDRFYNQQYGVAEADVQKAYDLMFNKSLGEFNADLLTLDDRTRIQIQYQLSARLEELSKTSDIQKDLAKYGVEGTMVTKVFDVFLKYLFGTGFSVGVGPINVSNSKP